LSDSPSTALAEEDVDRNMDSLDRRFDELRFVSA
jgi:hypothetical protein